MVTQNQAVLAAVGASLLALYTHGLPQKAYASLLGPDVPLQFQDMGGGSGASGQPGAQPSFIRNLSGAGPSPSVPGADTVPIPVGLGGVLSASLMSAETQAALTGQGRKDWFDFCLAWVHDTFAVQGNNDPLLALPTAYDACSRASLTPGLAPAGAAVCFGPGPTGEGHIGISNGNGTYQSAGLVSGAGLAGIVQRNYLNSGDYTGYFIP